MRFASACLVGSLLVPLLVPLGVSLCLRSRLASCFSCRRACCSSPLLSFRLSRLRLLLASHGFPIVMAPRIASPPRVPSLPAHRPANRVEQAGRHRLAYRYHVRRRRAASLPLSCGAFLPVWRAVPFLSKDFPRQSFKTFLGNVLKTFLDNLLETAKHTPSYIPPRISAVLLLCVAACRLAVLSRLCFELIKTARSFAIASRLVLRLAPRPVIPSCPPSAPCSNQSVLAAHRHLLRLAPRFSPIEPPPRTPRLTDTQNGEKNGERMIT